MVAVGDLLFTGLVRAQSPAAAAHLRGYGVGDFMAGGHPRPAQDAGTRAVPKAADKPGNWGYGGSKGRSVDKAAPVT